MFFTALRYAAIAFLALWVTVSCLAAPTGPLPIRAITYNIRYDNPADSLDGWPHRRDAVAALILFHKARIVGTQEGLAHQLSELAALLPAFRWVGLGRDDGHSAGEHCAIFYDSTRFREQRNGTFWLSPTPETPSKGWDAALNRICTWVELVEIATAKHFFVFNTHFDHMGVTAREESARLLADRVPSIAAGAPLLLMGDFNASDLEPPYRVLTEPRADRSLIDALTVSATPHYGPRETYSGFHVREGIVGERIDFIFTSKGVPVFEHATLSDFKADLRFPSDHLPVLIEFALP